MRRVTGPPAYSQPTSMNGLDNLQVYDQRDSGLPGPRPLDAWNTRDEMMLAERREGEEARLGFRVEPGLRAPIPRRAPGSSPDIGQAARW